MLTLGDVAFAGWICFEKAAFLRRKKRKLCVDVVLQLYVDILVFLLSGTNC